MSRDVPCNGLAETLASGREFAVWLESDAGDERLAYTIRRDGGAYRVRDADRSDVGSFADVAAAVRAGGRLMEDCRCDRRSEVRQIVPHRLHHLRIRGRFRVRLVRFRCILLVS